jgi:hypothetical protein
VRQRRRKGGGGSVGELYRRIVDQMERQGKVTALVCGRGETVHIALL